MEEQFEMNEPTDVETLDEFYEDTEDSGIIGKILVGGAVLAAGVAGSFVVKNKDKIKEKFEAKKEARRVKKVEKLMNKLNELKKDEPQTETVENKEE